MSTTNPTTTLHNRGPAVFTVTLVLFVVATFFLAARLISKFFVVKKPTADDFFAFLAWFFAMALSVSIMAGTRVGLGAPDSQILPEWELPLKKSIYAFTVFYNPALMATKTSILVLYWRMATAHPFLRRASIATMVIVDIAGTVLTFLGLFQCNPIQAAFTSDEGQCIDLVSLYLSSAPINILTDLAILFLPLPILTALRMEFRQKVVLVATFIVGGFVTIVDVVRIAYLQNALMEERRIDAGATISADTDQANFTYEASFSLMWSGVEVNVGLMCACVLVLKPLVMKIVPALLSSNRRLSTIVSFNRTSDTSSKDHEVILTPHPDTPHDESDEPLSFQAMFAEGPPETSSGSSGPGSAKPPSLKAIPEDEIPDIPAFGVAADLLEDTGGSGSKSPRSPRSPLSTPALPLSNGWGAKPKPSAGEEDDEDDGMDFFQMLASDPPPGVDPLSPVPNTPMSEKAPGSPRGKSFLRRSTFTSNRGGTGAGTGTTSSNRGGTTSSNRRATFSEPVQEPTQNFFDFVNMKGTTPLTLLSAKEAWWPIMFVNILFFLWGFAYGLLGTLNGQIQSLLGYNDTQTISLHNAYWIAYFFGPLIFGYYVLTREGFKATFIMGLSIYATGAMSFWPSSVLQSYGGFFVSNFIIAIGLACLEVAANPFIALAGPGELSEARLNFAQAIQGVGSIISPILAQKGLFSGIDEQDIFRLQWAYLAIALFVVGLAVVFFYVPLSEATDDELEAMCEQRLYNADLELKERWCGMDMRQVLLWTGAFAMWMYVGAQEAVSYFWTPISLALSPNTDPFWNQAIYHGIFALARFMAAGMCYWGVPPRIIAFGCMFGAFLTTLLAKELPSGAGALACAQLTTFFEGPIFPTLFAMTLRGQGKHTKFASTALTMAISGGAIWASVVYGINRVNDSARFGLIVTICLFAVSTLWPVILSSTRTFRRWVDPIWSRQRIVGLSERGGSVTDHWQAPDRPELRRESKGFTVHHQEHHEHAASSHDGEEHTVDLDEIKPSPFARGLNIMRRMSEKPGVGKGGAGETARVVPVPSTGLSEVPPTSILSAPAPTPTPPGEDAQGQGQEGRKKEGRKLSFSVGQ